MEGKEKPPSVPAVSNLVLEDKILMDFGDVLRHIGDQSGVYQKMQFILLAPCAATGVGYWCRIAECVDRTVGRRVVWVMM
jgi:hypothetical protein